MARDYQGPKPLRKEFGEMLESLPDTDDPNEKKKYYIKITAKPEVIAQIKAGDILEFESPKEKFNRLLASPKVSDEDKEKIQESIGKIPKFFIKRVSVKIKR